MHVLRAPHTVEVILGFLMVNGMLTILTTMDASTIPSYLIALSTTLILPYFSLLSIGVSAWIAQAYMAAFYFYCVFGFFYSLIGPGYISDY